MTSRMRRMKSVGRVGWSGLSNRPKRETCRSRRTRRTAIPAGAWKLCRGLDCVPVGIAYNLPLRGTRRRFGAPALLLRVPAALRRVPLDEAPIISAAWHLTPRRSSVPDFRW